jgi:hypothetical protein
MRLLNTRTWKLHEFISDDSIPPYAILSHTWDEEEVSYHQWESLSEQDLSALKGYHKIRAFGKKAAENDFEWCWVDTYVLHSSSRFI